jgi:hypothetical protein
MKKGLLSVALLSLFAVGTVNAQDQDKKKKDDNKTVEQPADVKTNDQKTGHPDVQQERLSNEQKAAEDRQKQFDPNQQPAQQPQPTDPKTDTVPR